MRFRTLADFRAEHGIRLTELAEKLEIPYNELEKIENSGAVPADIAEKIIAYYGLGNTYFTENIGAPPKPPVFKKTPKKPFLYFFLVFIVYTLIVGAITIFPSSLIISIGNMMASQTILSAMSIILRIWFAVAEIFGLALLSKYIIKHTTFEGNIYKYRYISYVLSTALFMPLNFVFGMLLDKLDNISEIWILVTLIDLAVSLLGTVISILIYALINCAAIETDSAKQNKTMNIICICVIAAQIIYGVLVLATKLDSDLFSASHVIKPCIYALIAVGILLKNKIGQKLDTVWYTALPIASFIIPVVFTAINNFIQ